MGSTTRPYLEDMKSKIENAIEANGPYSHNIVSLCLRSVAGKLGVAQANKLVDEFGLTRLYGIRKMEVKP